MRVYLKLESLPTEKLRQVLFFSLTLMHISMGENIQSFRLR